MLSYLEIGYEFVKLLSVNDEMYYTWSKFPLIPKPVNKARSLLVDAIQNEKPPSRREILEALNPDLVK